MGKTRPLYKTTIVIWSEYSGTSVELSDLARDAEGGESYCSKQDSKLVKNPQADPDWDDGEDGFFFGE